MNLKYVIAASALILMLVAGLVVYSKLQAPPPALTATLFPASQELPEFSLLDQHGNAVGREIFEGDWNLVFFGFTFCPDICPMTLAVLSDAKQQLSDAGHQPLPRIVLVSVDPERDTPQKLAEYLDYFGDGNLGLTGDIDEIRALTKELGIFFEKRQTEGDNYSVDHSAVVLLIDPSGRQHALFSAPHKADNFVNDFPRIAKKSP